MSLVSCMLGVSLFVKMWVSSTKASSGLLSERAVAGDEDRGPGACKMSSGWTSRDSMDKSSRDILPLWGSRIMMGDDREPNTVVGRLAVDSLLICQVALI